LSLNKEIKSNHRRCPRNGEQRQKYTENRFVTLNENDSHEQRKRYHYTEPVHHDLVADDLGSYRIVNLKFVHHLQGNMESRN